MLKQIKGNGLFQNFLEKFKQEGSEELPTPDNEDDKELSRLKNMTMRKFVPTNVNGCFTVMRQRVEKMVEDGYTFMAK